MATLTSASLERIHSNDTARSSHPAAAAAAAADDAHSKVSRWLLSARQSLTSVSFLCNRANTLVTTARRHLTGSFSLAARVAFVAAGLRDQLDVSREVFGAFGETERSAAGAFREVLRGLDEADRRLSAVLEELRGMLVDRVFLEGGGAEGERRLADFVDDEGVEGLRAGLRDCIDLVQESHEGFQRRIAEFEADLRELEALLKPISTPVPLPGDNPLIPHIASLEEHAHAMAGLLEAIARHYDQCASALKDLDSPDLNISEEEQAEMLTVLERDSAEVEDVVLEMKERLATMEELMQTSIEPYIHGLEASEDAMLTAFQAYETFQAKLRIHLAGLAEYESNQKEYAAQMEEKLVEMEGLNEFYQGFREAYFSMFGEVKRRAEKKEMMRKVAEEAMAKIQKLYEEDLAEREAFRKEQGEFLPQDIWPGLMDEPPRFEIREVEGSGVAGSSVLRGEGLNGTIQQGEGY